jgi:hypothetical protein
LKEELQAVASRCLAMIAGEKQMIEAVATLQINADTIVKNSSKVGELVDRFTTGLGLVSDLSIVDANKTVLVKAGAVRALISAFEAIGKMPEGSKKQKAQVDAAHGLLRLSSNKDAGIQIIKGGGLKAVMNAAILYPDNVELAEAAMNVLALLSSDPENVQDMLDEGAVQQIGEVCNLHPDNARILAAAGRALGFLAHNDAAALMITRHGGAQLAVDAVLLNLNDPNALANALQTISCLAVNDETVKALVEAGAIDAIIKALRKYGDNPEIVGACVQALCQLCIDADIAKEIGDKGGCPLLVQAMREHYEAEAICEMDMVLLDSLASVPENAEKLLKEELEACDLIKWSMKAYGTNVPLCEAGQSLLDTLLGPEVATMDGSVLLTPEQAESMLMSMASGSLSPNQMLTMLQNLAAACSNPANAKLLVKQGGLQQLAKIMSVNKNNEAIFHAAAGAFVNMADYAGEEAWEVMEDPMLIEALSEMIKPQSQFANPMNLQDLTKAVGCTSNIKMKPKVVQEMIKNRPFEALMKMLVESDDDMLLQNASRLLGKVRFCHLLCTLQVIELIAFTATTAIAIAIAAYTSIHHHNSFRQPQTPQHLYHNRNRLRCFRYLTTRMLPPCLPASPTSES